MKTKHILVGAGIVGVAILGIVVLRAYPEIGRAAVSGVITISGRIAGVTAPVDDNDAATKAYVNTQAAGVTYQGRTSATYDGNLGGVAGANAKCQVNFASSHICSQGELIKGGATNFGGDGWLACDGFLVISGANQCMGILYRVSQVTPACSQYTNAGASSYGPTANASGTFGEATCDTTRSIHCCK